MIKSEDKSVIKKQLVIVGIVAVLVTIALSGCNQISNSYINEKNKFIGTWTYVVPAGTDSNYTFIYCFFLNGTFIFQQRSFITNGTFDIIDGKLWLVTNTNGNKEYGEYSYAFSENNTKLTIDRNTYIKQ